MRDVIRTSSSFRPRSRPAVYLGIALLVSGCVATASAKPPKWVQQAQIVGEAALSFDIAGPPPELSPDDREKLDAYVAARWKAAEEGPASKYLDFIEDRNVANEWLRSPQLVEPANLILVDPLEAEGLDRDPVYYVNGPWRTRAEAVDEATALAEQMKQAVWLLYNPTVKRPDEINREEYLRLISFLVFFGLPVPENLVEATLEGAQLVNIDGSDEKSLADVAEAQWDTHWYDWMSQAPEIEIGERTQSVYPHQHNETTRQLASVLLSATRPLTVVTHSQGGLIFRNASLVAAKLGGEDWSTRRVTWRSLALPLAEKPQKLPLPSVIQVQMVFTPQDALALALSGRGPFAKWQNPSGQPDDWGFGPKDEPLGGRPNSRPRDEGPYYNKPYFDFRPWPMGPDTLPEAFDNYRPPEPKYQYGKRVQFTNISSQKVRVYVQYMRQSGSANGPYQLEPTGVPTMQWKRYELNAWQSAILRDGGKPIVTPVIQYWADYEYGWRETTYRSTPHWLVDRNNPSYLSDTPLTHPISLPQPTGTMEFTEKLVVATNASKESIMAQIEGRWRDIDGNPVKQLSKQSEIPTNTSASDAFVFRDETGWPVRASSLVHGVKMESKSGNAKYAFASGQLKVSNDPKPGDTTVTGPFPYPNPIAMKFFPLNFPPK